MFILKEVSCGAEWQRRLFFSSEKFPTENNSSFFYECLGRYYNLKDFILFLHAQKVKSELQKKKKKKKKIVTDILSRFFFLHNINGPNFPKRVDMFLIAL